MDTTLLATAISCSSALVAVLALRRLPRSVRIAFDLLCFMAISIYLLKMGVSPFLEATRGALPSNLLALRVVACAWWLLGARVLIAVLWFSLHRNGQSRAARLSSDVSSALIYLAAMLVIVKFVLSLPLSGVLATSGVFAIVLGLALQNTLGDVFAGIAVGVESPFKVGDRIALADKLEGQVVQVNWRSVWIQTDDNDVAIIPNSLVAKNQLINRSYPTQRRSVSVELSCPKNALPDRVIDTLQSATWLCPAVLRMPAPYAVLTRLGRRAHHYCVSFSVDGTRGLASTKGALLRHCHRQLYYAGLLSEALPFRLPVRAAALLHDLVLFESLEEKLVSRLAEQVESIDLDSEEVLFAENSTDATLYIVASGIVQLVRGLGSAAADTIGCIGAGDYVGEIGLLIGSPHAATATALTPCRVYALARGAIAPLLAEHADLALAFDKSVRRGLNILNRDVSVRATDAQNATGSLVARIRGYFHLG